MEKVSVIVPVYNAKEYLEGCVKSLSEQTYPNIEIILVDDGSTDGSGELCDKAAEKNSKIKVIHQINQGVSYTRNTGLRAATGDYICFVDSDDSVENNYVERLLTEIIKQQVDLAMCGWYENERQYTFDGKSWTMNASEALYFLLAFQGGHCLALWNKIFRTDIAQTCSFESELSYLEDGVFICDYLKKIKKVYIFGEMLYRYKINPSSLTHDTKPTEKRFSALNGRLLLVKRVEEYPIKIQKIAKAKYQETLRYLLIGSYRSGYRKEIRPYLSKLKIYRKEFYTQKGISFKGKIRYLGYALILKWDLGTNALEKWDKLRQK